MPTSADRFLKRHELSAAEAFTNLQKSLCNCRPLLASDLSRPATPYAMIENLFCRIFLGFWAAQAFAWTDGELLIWIGDKRDYHVLVSLGKTFEKEIGVSVKVETQEQITETNFRKPLGLAKALISFSGRTIVLENGPIPD